MRLEMISFARTTAKRMSQLENFSQVNFYNGLTTSSLYFWDSKHPLFFVPPNPPSPRSPVTSKKTQGPAQRHAFAASQLHRSVGSTTLGSTQGAGEASGNWWIWWTKHWTHKTMVLFMVGKSIGRDGGRDISTLFFHHPFDENIYLKQS